MKFIKSKKKEVCIFVFLIVIMSIGCLILYKPLCDLFANPQQLQESLYECGVFGPLFMILAMTLQIIFVFLPGEIIEVMAGFFYGSMGGLLIGLLGSALGSIIVFLFVRKFGVSFVDKLIGVNKMNSLPILQDQKRRNILLFIVFFIPGTPKDILTYMMPLTSIPLSSFLFITTIARIPSIITSTFCGQAIGDNQYIVSIFIFMITGVISVLGIYIYKRINDKKKTAYNL